MFSCGTAYQAFSYSTHAFLPSTSTPIARFWPMRETVTSMSAAIGSVLLLPSAWNVIGAERSCLAVGSLILLGSPSMSSLRSAVKAAEFMSSIAA